jgi:hypothetical protein
MFPARKVHFFLAINKERYPLKTSEAAQTMSVALVKTNKPLKT